MNKKGFTLAELLGVIVILSIIGIIAFTGIDRNIKNGRYTSCKTQEKNLIESTKVMVIDYPNVLPTISSPTEVPVAVLQDGGTIKSQVISGGYIEDNLENPMTEKPYAQSNVKVKITTTNGKDYNYEVIFANEKESCHK